MYLRCACELASAGIILDGQRSFGHLCKKMLCRCTVARDFAVSFGDTTEATMITHDLSNKNNTDRTHHSFGVV